MEPRIFHKNTQKRVALIGAGYWGENHLRVLDTLGVLAIVCDSNVNAGRTHPKINFTQNYSDVLENKNIDAVVIATPTPTHFRLARAALEAGKDVFVEKPLSLSVADGEQLVTLAKQKNKILMVGHLLHYHPAVVKMKELVLAGELGEIRFIEARRMNWGVIRNTEDVLWSIAPHDISLTLSLLNEFPSKISLYSANYIQPSIADTAHIYMRFTKNIQTEISVSWLHPFKERRFIISGDKKTLVLDDMAPNKLVMHDTEVTGTTKKPIACASLGVPIYFDPTEPLENELRHFLECITKRAKPITDGDEGVATLRVLEMCVPPFTLNTDYINGKNGLRKREKRLLAKTYDSVS